MALQVEEFFESINQLSQRKIESTPIDLTVDATVKMLYNVEIGEYKVEYQANTFSAFSLDPTIVYSKNEQVYVLVPQGDFSAKKIILGISKYKNTTSYTQRQDMINQYIPKGPNWVDPDPKKQWYKMDHYNMDITAVPLDEKSLLDHTPPPPGANAYYEDIGFNLVNPAVPDQDPQTKYPATHMATQLLERGNKSVSDYGTYYKHVLISADFETKFNSVHSAGEYYLEVELLVKNPAYIKPGQPNYDATIPEFLTMSCPLGFSEFTGDLYNMNVASTQKAAYETKIGEVKGLSKISLCQDGLLTADITTLYDATSGEPIDEFPDYTDNNISVSNISIRFAEKINLTDNLYYVDIETPFGVKVYDTIPGPPEIPGREAVVLEGHLRYGFQEILEKETCEVQWYKRKLDITESDDRYDKDAGCGWCRIEDLEDAELYTVDFNVLIVQKEAVVWAWDYMMKVVYQKERTLNLKGFVTVERDGSKYELELSKYCGSDNKSTFLMIMDMLDLQEVKVIGKPGETEWVPREDWYGTWYKESGLGNYTQLAGKKNFKGPLDVSQMITDQGVVHFLVACFDPKDPAGPCVGNLSQRITTALGGRMKLRWIMDPPGGRFNYNANGLLQTYGNPKQANVHLDLQWLEDPRDYSLTFFGPDNKPIRRINSTTETVDMYGLDYDGSMMEKLWLSTDNVLHFYPKPTLDKSKIQNTIRAEIELTTSEIIEDQCEFFFSKDGDSGTNGSDWHAPIAPTNSTDYTLADGVVAEAYTRNYYDQVKPLMRSKTSNGYVWDKVTNRLIIRPFITKSGILLEELGEREAYTYRIFWDVRLPQNTKSSIAANSSWLRLCEVESGQTPFNRNLLSDDVRGRQVLNPPDTDGLVAQTFSYSKTSGPNTHNTYGAIEITGVEQPGIDISLDGHYNFIVRANIDIYQGTPKEGDDPQPPFNLVASIKAWYPVDVFFNEDNITTFKSEWVHTNWPREVEYDPGGYAPQAQKDALYFKYCPTNSPLEDNENYMAMNLTKDIQKVTLEASFIDSIVLARLDQYYKPVGFYQGADGYVGALGTNIGSDASIEWADDFKVNNIKVSATDFIAYTTASPFGKGFYVRNQIFYLNAFHNVDVNGWDGLGISINEETGTILAPLIGAGFKRPGSNTFTGVLMGRDNSQLKSTWTSRRFYQELEEWEKNAWTAEELKKNPYMIGIFGYQEGISSFGIMENGTAFFGRSDRGGRIIIDGYNATIYGGANGPLLDPEIGDPMWNNMRLTFVDMSYPTSYYEAVPVDKVTQGFLGNFYGSEDKWEADGAGTYYPTPGLTNDISVRPGNDFPWWFKWTWEHAWIVKEGNLPPNIQYQKADGLDPNKYIRINYWNPTESVPAWHYGEGLADFDWGYTFPNAIHNPNPDPPGSGNQSLIAPDFTADRDQTLQRSAFGASRASTTPAIEIGQHQPGLLPGAIPPSEIDNVLKSIKIPGNRNFLVTYDGSMWAMNATVVGNIIGSNIVGGTILGAEIHGGLSNGYSPRVFRTTTGIDNWPGLLPPIETDMDIPNLTNQGGAFSVDIEGNVYCQNIRIFGGTIHLGRFHVMAAGDKDNPSHQDVMINFGETDLVGTTHFYGNVGIGMPRTDQLHQGGNGNFFQVHGLVGLGIQEEHAKFMDEHCRNLDPKYAPFFIDSSLDRSPFKEKNEIAGYFWPIHFHIDKSDADKWTEGAASKSWMTTMNAFKSAAIAGNSVEPVKGGHNYFRVSPLGTSVVRLGVRFDWLDEHTADKVSFNPSGAGNSFRANGDGKTKTDFVGTMGPQLFTGSKGKGDTPTVGWGFASAINSSINFTSGWNFGISTYKDIVMYSGMDGGDYMATQSMSREGHVSISAVKEYGLSVHPDKPGALWDGDMRFSMMTEGAAEGIWLEAKHGKNIHIFASNIDNNRGHSEIWLADTQLVVHSNNVHVGGTAICRIYSGPGKPHMDGDWGGGYMQFTPTKLEVVNYKPEQQEGIYARFA